jgi:hypothetical protein
VERQKEAITAAVHQLQLSTQQVQQISQATAVFKRLLAPLIQGRQKLQCTGFTAASAAAATQMPGLKLEGGGVSRAVFPQQAAVLQRLQQQQRKVASLSTMMKKVRCLFVRMCEPVVVFSHELAPHSSRPKRNSSMFKSCPSRGRFAMLLCVLLS